MSKTSIEWATDVWNPVVGCTWASSGCDHCYAATMTRRLEAMGKPDYVGLTSKKHFNGTVRTLEHRLADPLHWRKPRRVFVNSMSDLFHKDVPFDFIHRVYVVMRNTLQHTYQILTKRPERRVEFYRWEAERARREVDYVSLPLPNVWEGTSAENQMTLVERIGHLRRVQAVVRFLSFEPLLGPINVTSYGDTASLRGIHWVIVGGESGPGARPMHPNWARSLRDQCVADGAGFFFKQWGEYGTISQNMTNGEPFFRMFTSKQHWINKASTWVNGGTCIDAAGKILRVGEDFDAAAYPVAIMHRMGKKAAGRLLDGRQWNEFPQLPGAEVTS